MPSAQTLLDSGCALSDFGLLSLFLSAIAGLMGLK
jgi:hypothetical protein